MYFYLYSLCFSRQRWKTLYLAYRNGLQRWSMLIFVFVIQSTFVSILPFIFVIKFTFFISCLFVFEILYFQKNRRERINWKSFLNLQYLVCCSFWTCVLLHCDLCFFSLLYLQKKRGEQINRGKVFWTSNILFVFFLTFLFFIWTFFSSSFSCISKRI